MKSRLAFCVWVIGSGVLAAAVAGSSMNAASAAEPRRAKTPGRAMVLEAEGAQINPERLEIVEQGIFDRKR